MIRQGRTKDESKYKNHTYLRSAQTSPLFVSIPHNTKMPKAPSSSKSTNKLLRSQTRHQSDVLDAETGVKRPKESRRERDRSRAQMRRDQLKSSLKRLTDSMAASPVGGSSEEVDGSSPESLAMDRGE